jgi:coenzyme F420 hydrogenase subunit beta
MLIEREEGVKSFRDLIQEVQNPGFCGRCGGCVSFCSAGDLHALSLDKNGFPVLLDEEKCLKCGICYLICPQVKVLDSELNKKYLWRKPVGNWRSLHSAKTTNRKVAKVATDGGVVTSLLLYALETGIIDGAIVSRRVGPFARQPAVATTAKELIDAAGSHFDETAQLSEVGKSYTSFVPSILEVKELRQRGLTRVALVGTPCQVYSLRKMQLLKVVPSDAVALVIGLFCMENFSFTSEERKKLERKLHFRLDKVEKLNIKDDIIVALKGGEILHIPFELIDEIARPACFACSDFSSEFADISCGGLGSPDGFTTVIIRTQAGEQVFNGAKHKGFISEMKFSSKEKRQIHKTTQMAKIVAFSQRKRERAARTLRGR